MGAEPPTCPKCGHVAALPCGVGGGGNAGEGGAACPRCGLLTARFAAFVDEPEAHPVLDARWAALSARLPRAGVAGSAVASGGAWEDEAAHREFVDEAARQGGLDIAAQRYRQHLRAHPDDPVAKQALARLALLAEQLQRVAAEGERAAAGRLRRAADAVTLVWALVLLAIAALGLYYALRAPSNGS
jgi:hypothetical protein